MAEETVVKEPLTEEMIAAGQEVVRRLHAEKFDTVSAFWLFTTEFRQWYFVIASPKVEKEGPLKVYGRIHKVLKKVPAGAPAISLFDVKVVPSDYPLVKPLRKLLRSGRGLGNGSAGVRLTRRSVGDAFIEDAYVYRAA
jgi:hypothetical protein